MAQPASIPLAVTAVSTEAETIPWHVWCCLAAVTCGVAGAVWDVSWHESIGRDSFWTPAHVLIYLCGVLAGMACGYLILATTFRRNSLRGSGGVAMWGFRAPLGAFICVWGAIAMITSAPFDNWWHEAYGLDVKILSPPHVLLALGMTAIRFGTVVLIASAMNRSTGQSRARLERILFVVLMFLLGMTVGIAQELTSRPLMHGAKFFLVVMLGAPIWMAVAARASENRWAATIMTGAYTAMHLGFCWLIPLFPAEPKLGPVYHQVTHLVPPDFPLLLIVPALVFDLVRRWTSSWSRQAQAVTLGAAFLLSFLAVQWPFADFLMSPASRNRIFVTNQYPYFTPSTSAWVRNVYVATERAPTEFWVRMGLALAAAIVMTRIGWSCGEWLKRVRR